MDSVKLISHLGTLCDLGKFNIILGKNGSGKSTLLRSVAQSLDSRKGCSRYVTPERGGDLVLDGGVEINNSQNDTWIIQTRRRNRAENFRQTVVSDFRRLETLVLRRIESDKEIRNSDFSFDNEVRRINNILDRVKVERTDRASLNIVTRDGGSQALTGEKISSGESELVSLAIEMMVFAYLSRGEIERALDEAQELSGDENNESESPDTIGVIENFLLIDEPDVHLHPDLQSRLMSFLVELLEDVDAKVIIATHSTAIISAIFSQYKDLRIAFLGSEQEFGADMQLKFEPVDHVMQEILPVFGAHPLSSVFNSLPPLIVEGEDDERIWQTAVRSSGGRLSFFPCVAGDIQSLNQFEGRAHQLIESVYENGVAYSLRDGDGVQGELSDEGSVRRARLACRAAENLLLSDDCIAEMGLSSFDELATALDEWLEGNAAHIRFGDVISFRESGWDRQYHDLKNLRMLFVGLSGSTKPWETIVGRAIAKIPHSKFDGEHSLTNYLGVKAVSMLGLKG